MTNKEVKLSQDEVRNTTLEILNKIKEVCSELDINFWVMYGTLIGAVRHEGFIPWDDDFDIAMKRNDYEKFLNHCINNKEALSPYYVDHFSCNVQYPFYIARICDPTYKLEFKNMKYKSGVFIDLYPFDGMGNDLDYWRRKKGSNDNRRDIYYYNMLVFGKNLKFPFTGNSLSYRLQRGLLGCYAKTKSNIYWMNKLDKLTKVFTWENSKYVGVPTWSSRVYSLRREWFEKIEYLKFENTTVPVPSEYKKILKEIYGDYMSLPPKEQQVPTHWYTAYKNE